MLIKNKDHFIEDRLKNLNLCLDFQSEFPKFHNFIPFIDLLGGNTVFTQQ